MFDIEESKKEMLSDMIANLQHALCELEMDYSGENNTEENIGYVITELLTSIYSSGSYKDLNDVIGLLTNVSMNYSQIAASGKQDIEIVYDSK